MAKPKLALIPATQGSKLYSVLPADGVGDFTFSRNTGATRINKDGLIETVAVGKSRLNYPLIDGVVNGCPSHLLEPERLQLIQYSEDFSNAAWVKTNIAITSNNTISPDGALNGTKLNENTVSSTNFRLRGSSVVTTGANTLSIFAKASERNWIKLRENAQTGVYAFFDLKNGIVGQTNADDAIIEYYGNGWYKLSITDVLTSAAIDVRIAISNGVDTYNGVIGNGVYVWGAQLEQGSYATSYIPNYGTSAGITRVAETANGAGDASTFNSLEGVLMAEISALADDADTLRWINLSDGGTSNRVAFYYRTDENQLTYLVSSGGTQVFSTVTLSSASSFNKIAAKYKQNDFSLWINGYELITDTNGNAPVGLNDLSFDNAVGGDNFYGSAKQLQYFDSALNDSDLETITSWTSFTDLANGQTYSIK